MSEVVLGLNALPQGVFGAAVRGIDLYVETVLYRHRWAVADLVLWDNRTTLNRRDAFNPKARRVMHRTQIRGSGAPQRAARG